MEQSNVEQLFEWIDQTTELVQQHQNDIYLESLTITLEYLFYQDASIEDDTLLHKLQQSFQAVEISNFETYEIREAIQLAILKGMKGSTQQQHLMTPETVGLVISYLVNKLKGTKESLRIFDPVSGTGNLLNIVLDQLDIETAAYASEIDPTLIKLSALSSNLQKNQVEFFHQDSLQPFLLEPVDLVIADLPVGYYPDDVRANNFSLKRDAGHSYSHHLLIEQSLHYTKQAGFLIFLIPEFLFDSEESDKLHSYLQEHAHIVGVIRLPDGVFKSEKNRKSIFILQKKGPETSNVKQPLLVQMPSFKDAEATKDILQQMDAWFQTFEG